MEFINYNFNGLNMKTVPKVKRGLERLNEIASSIEVERTPLLDKQYYKSYEITFKKDEFSKVFYINLHKGTKTVRSIIFNDQILHGTTNSVHILIALRSIEDEILVSKNPELKDIMKSIRHKNELCPICNSKMHKHHINTTNQFYNLYCNNKCYNASIYEIFENENNLLMDIYIFEDKDFDTYYNLHKNNYKEEELARIKKIYKAYETINDWRKDDKYLINILGGFQ